MVNVPGATKRWRTFTKGSFLHPGIGVQVAELSVRAQLLHKGDQATVQIKAFNSCGISIEHPRLGLILLLHDAAAAAKTGEIGPSNIFGALKKMQHGPAATTGTTTNNPQHLLLIHCALQTEGGGEVTVFGCNRTLLVVQASGDAIGKFVRETSAEWRKLDSAAAITTFDSVYDLESAVQDAVSEHSAVVTPEFAVDGIGQSSSVEELR